MFEAPMSLEGEEWMPIKDYEGLYEVSNFGRVKSLCAGKWKSTTLRKPQPTRNGYMAVTLKKSGKVRSITVHRLVAIAFLDNSDGLREVNHKDEDKTNNCVDNLEWCTRKYNQNYNERYKIYYKPVIQLTKDGMEVGRYESLKAAQKSTGIPSSYISGVLRGRRRTTGGFRWQYQF
jgi:hypothetical protein